MRTCRTPLLLLALLALLTACAGSQKGVDYGWGFDAMNTQSKADKENEKWFDGFYGSRHCIWGDDCAASDDKGGGGGGMWTGGVGPSDSGSSSSAGSDSGAGN